VLAQEAPDKVFFKKIKNFFAECLTAWHLAKADGSWPPSRRPPFTAAKFCRVPGTRQRQFFADGWTLPSAECRAPDKGYFAEGLYLLGASKPGTRQRFSLLGAR
jgi:hypothetical protein